LYRI
jgi:hypothetical protein